jgi:hypothetical protein
LINILHGKGNDQEFLTYSFLNKRRKGLLDRDSLSSDDRTLYDIEETDGTGRTDPDTFKIKQHPFPVDKSKKTIDVRSVKPELGEQSDV